MNHVKFHGANKVLLPPVGQRGVAALHVRQYDHPQHGPMVQSVWEPTMEERLIISTGGVVVLHVLGQTHPPLMLTCSALDRPPEEKSDG